MFQTHLHLNCIKHCSTQKGILVIDEFGMYTNGIMIFLIICCLNYVIIMFPCPYQTRVLTVVENPRGSFNLVKKYSRSGNALIIGDVLDSPDIFKAGNDARPAISYSSLSIKNMYRNFPKLLFFLSEKCAY